MSDDAPREIVVEGKSSGFANLVTIGAHSFAADEPVAAGGGDTGPSPYDLLCAALGACTSMTVSVYARRKGWPIESVRVHVRHSKIHARDCAACETKEGMVDRLEREIELVGAVDDAQRQRLLEIANKCPVHRTLTSEISIATRLIP